MNSDNIDEKNNNACVKFLESYAPSSSNLSLFDEHVQRLALYYDIQKYKINIDKSKDTIQDHIEELTHGAVILSGTAGDGKSYLLGQLIEYLETQNYYKYTDDLTNDFIERTQANVVIYKHFSKVIYFVKDCTALNDRESNEFFSIFFKSLEDEDCKTVCVVCANEGQLLHRVQQFMLYIKDDEIFYNQAKNFLDIIRNYYLFNKEIDSKKTSLYIYNLKEFSSHEKFKEALDQVLEEDRWLSCLNCDYSKGEHICPIYNNYLTLKNKTVQERVSDLIELTIANNDHITIREFFMLAANLILGGNLLKSSAKNKDVNIFSCSIVDKIFKEKISFKSTVFNNVLGLNLNAQERASLPIFLKLNKFNLGQVSSKAIDNFIMYGDKLDELKDKYISFYKKLEEYNKENISRFDVFKKNLFTDSLSNEFSNKEIDTIIQDIRRAYFFLAKDERESLNFWNCTIYKYAKEYLILKNQITEKEKSEDKDQDYFVDNQIFNNTLIGVNILFTGLNATASTENLYVSMPAGSINSWDSPIFIDTFKAQKNLYHIDEIEESGFYISYNDRSLPMIVVAIKDKNDGNQIKKHCFELTLNRFEYIYRTANNCMPTSFSNICFEDFLRFKSNIIAKTEANNRNNRLTIISLKDNIFKQSTIN